MKRIFKYIAIAVLLAVSFACSKEESSVGAPASSAEEHGYVHFYIGDPQTRVDISSNTETLAYETAVNSLFVGIYGDDGLLDWCSTDMTLGTPETVTVRTGTNKTIIAVANYPSPSTLAACKSVSEIDALYVDLEDNSTDSSVGFVMTGRITGLVINKDEVVSRSITLSRLTTRLALKRLCVDLDDDSFDYYQGKPFILKCVYLANVCGKARLDGNGCDDTWYNIGGRSLFGSIIEADAIEAFLDSELAVPDLTYSSDCYYDGGTECNPDGLDYDGYPSQHEFDFFEGLLYDGNGDPIAGELDDKVSILYCYAPLATPSYTSKFVLELSFQAPSGDWVNYYYPVALNGIRAGYSYAIDMTITKLGSLDPDTEDWVEYIDSSVDFGGEDDGGVVIIDF